MDIDSIINRIKDKKRLQHHKDVAKLLGLSPSGFTNRKKTGGILAQIVKWAVKDNIDLNWLIYGSQKYNEDNEGKSINGGKLDTELHKSIITVVEKFLVKEGLALPPDKKAEVISILYQLYYDSGKNVEGEMVKRYLKLVA